MTLAQAHGGGSGGGSGGVTSVGLSAPTEFAVTGSPITTSGTLALAWASGLANRVLATPDGSTGVPVFRALVAADIPALDAAKISSGVLNNARIDWASPSAIGATTPQTGTFTRLFVANSSPSSPDNSGVEFSVDSSQTLLRWRSSWTIGSLRRNSNDLEVWSQNGGFTLQTAVGASLTFSGRFTPTRQALESNLSVVCCSQTTTLTNTRATFGLSHRSSGTPSAGFGQNIEFLLKSSTTNDVQAARLAVQWQTATHASRTTELIVTVTDFAAERELWRGQATGSAAAIGFLGATPVGRQNVAVAATDLATAITLINDVRAALIAFGLVN